MVNGPFRNSKWLWRGGQKRKDRTGLTSSTQWTASFRKYVHSEWISWGKKTMFLPQFWKVQNCWFSRSDAVVRAGAGARWWSPNSQALSCMYVVSRHGIKSKFVCGKFGIPSSSFVNIILFNKSCNMDWVQETYTGGKNEMPCIGRASQLTSQ